MRALVRTHSLPQLAASANREHLACEQAYGTAIEHAFRAGEHLLAAKAEVAHGDWMAWVEENFRGSYRSAAAYMQVARDPELQSAATFDSLGEALKAIASPRESGPVDAEVVDAEPEAEAPRSVVDMLRDEGGLEEVEQGLEEEDRRREEEMRERFPRPGVERTTVRQIREAGRRAERALDATTSAGSQGMGDWSCGQGMDRVAAQHQEAADAARELAKVLDEQAREV